MDLKHGFLVGTWEVRPLTGELIGAAGTAHLEPKVMEVLLALASNPVQSSSARIATASLGLASRRVRRAADSLYRRVAACFRRLAASADLYPDDSEARLPVVEPGRSARRRAAQAALTASPRAWLAAARRAPALSAPPSPSARSSRSVAVAVTRERHETRRGERQSIGANTIAVLPFRCGRRPRTTLISGKGSPTRS